MLDALDAGFDDPAVVLDLLGVPGWVVLLLLVSGLLCLGEEGLLVACCGGAGFEAVGFVLGEDGGVFLLAGEGEAVPGLR